MLWHRQGFANYGKTFVKGDWATKLSYLIFGVGDLSKGKYYKGILFFAVEVLYILYMAFFGWGYLKMFPTLGIQAQRTEYINGIIPKQVPGDNSMLILLYSVLTLVITVVVFAIYITNIKDALLHAIICMGIVSLYCIIWGKIKGVDMKEVPHIKATVLDIREGRKNRYPFGMGHCTPVRNCGGPSGGFYI